MGGSFQINYRHAFHAGNFADVLKHAVLARVLVYLTRKESPFRFIDTHAGAGPIRSDERGGEALAGMARWDRADSDGRAARAESPSSCALILKPLAHMTQRAGRSAILVRQRSPKPSCARRIASRSAKRTRTNATR